MARCIDDESTALEKAAACKQGARAFLEAGRVVTRVARRVWCGRCGRVRGLRFSMGERRLSGSWVWEPFVAWSVPCTLVADRTTHTCLFGRSQEGCVAVFLSPGVLRARGRTDGLIWKGVPHTF